ncbi:MULTISPECIES: hypothetical protein [Bacillus cereus group]|uniref:hypothetical protein n=1 Tax=Bacillus cereus group TaxID=86661 RepID=UPI000B4ACE6C|nr:MULTISPECIES: hypothetical protein [Bacillus cereus group]HEF1900648.1 hypothetical protein [Bacillus cereus]
MNNYYPYNGSYIPQIPQQVPKTLYRETANRPFNVGRRFDLDVAEATQQNLENGFIRYLWAPTQVNIQPNEIIDFRLNGRANQQVISAGYATDPLEDIYLVQMYPRHTNVMTVLLRSSTLSSSPSRIHMWLIVKQN